MADTTTKNRTKYSNSITVSCGNLGSVCICSLYQLGYQTSSPKCYGGLIFIECDAIQTTEVDNNVLLIDAKGCGPVMGAGLGQESDVVCNAVVDPR
jgi:hypothetical protein